MDGTTTRTYPLLDFLMPLVGRDTMITPPHGFDARGCSYDIRWRRKLLHFTLV